jgi:hypothetical protein
MKSQPKIIYVSFRKEDGSRCCSFDMMKELRVSHPDNEYTVVAYVPRKTRKK